MDPKFFEDNHSYGLTEKSDIYNLGVLFWELTSHLIDERPYFNQVIQELDSFNPIDPIDSENDCNCISTGLNSNELNVNNESESTENVDSDLPSYEEYDINSDRYNIYVITLLTI
ncbi:hypothetical protein C1646_757061 [Rhizophagus diaphanus]|nr:hypothetical protein C1646_757061 [Rhizophagus diaphanus] [Rhizophagus sp. MUCL 43196]